MLADTARVTNVRIIIIIISVGILASLKHRNYILHCNLMRNQKSCSRYKPTTDLRCYAVVIA